MEKHPRRPVNKQSLIDIELSVSALISPEGKWRSDVLNNLFPPEDVVRIGGMQIGRVQDRFIWAYNDHGSYTVKSGYWFISNVPFIPSLPQTALETSRLALKQRIWRLRTQPKIRMFLWRVVSGALAVSHRLQSRGLNVNVRCKLCHNQPETINHVLFGCTMAQQLWFTAQLPFPNSGFGISLEDNLTYALDLMEGSMAFEDIKAAIPWILWNVWKNRNSILYAQQHDSTSRVIQRAFEECKIWSEVNKKSDTRSVSVRKHGLVNCWQPPLPGAVKCNINSTWRNAALHNGGAWIVRNHRRDVLFHARDAFTCSPNRIVAELRCILWALQSLRDLRFSEVVVGLDCKSAFDALTKVSAWPRYRVLLSLINELRRCFSSCVFEIESIGTNSIARAIATSVTRDGRFNSYLALGGPAWLDDRILQEANS